MFSKKAFLDNKSFKKANCEHKKRTRWYTSDSFYVESIDS